MFKRGTLVKVSNDMCEVFGLPIIYGIIVSTDLMYISTVRLLEVLDNEGECFELHHFCLDISNNELEEV